MDRSKPPALLRCLSQWLIRDTLWLVWDRMTDCDRYALLLACCNKKVDKQMLALYARDGYNDLFQQYLSNETYSTQCNFEASRRGDAEMLDLILAEGYPLTSATACVTVAHGHIDCLDYLMTVIPRRELQDDHNLAFIAGATGRVDIVNKLWEFGLSNEFNIYRLMSGAACNSHLEVIKSLEDFDVGMEEACRDAASTGQLNVVQYLYRDGMSSIFDTARDEGHYPVIKWLLDKTADITEVYYFAEKYGPEMLEWLLTNGVTMNNTYPWHIHAAENGRIDSSEWLIAHDKDITDTRNVWIAAMGNDQLQYLKWLDSQNIPMNGGYLVLQVIGMTYNHYECVRWFVNRCGQPFACSYKSACDFGRVEDALHWLEFIHSCGVELSEFVYKYCEGCRPETLAWIRAKLDAKK